MMLDGASHLPVVEGELRGIVSIRDLAEWSVAAGLKRRAVPPSPQATWRTRANLRSSGSRSTMLRRYAVELPPYWLRSRRRRFSRGGPCGRAGRSSSHRASRRRRRPGAERDRRLPRRVRLPSPSSVRGANGRLAVPRPAGTQLRGAPARRGRCRLHQARARHPREAWASAGCRRDPDLADVVEEEPVFGAGILEQLGSTAPRERDRVALHPL